jgi:hypothetical protein
VRLQTVLGRDSNARPVLPMGELATDREHLSLARAFVTVVAACPRYSGRKAADFDSKDVIRMLSTSIRSMCVPMSASVGHSVPCNF